MMAPSVRTRKKEKTSNVAAEKSESDAPEPKTAEVTSFKAAAAEPQAAPSPPAPASLPPRWVPTTAVAILTAAAWPSLLVFSSLCLASMGHSLASEWTGNGIATISRTIDSKWELAALVGWRAAELAVAWYADFDTFSQLAMSIISHVPLFYLLAAFYDISAREVVGSMVVDLLSLSIPFQLARQLYDSIRTKGSSTPAISANVTRPPLAKDLVLQIYATVLAAAIYSVALFIAYQSFLAKTLVVHFAGLATVEPAHKATFLSLLPIGIIFGLACDAFIFIPAASSTATSNEDDSGHFDPVTASLGETVRYNLWGWNSRTKVVLRRTALLALLVVPATIYLQSAYALQGVDARGAAAWAAVWAAAAGAAGLGLGFVVGGA